MKTRLIGSVTYGIKNTGCRHLTFSKPCCCLEELLFPIQHRLLSSRWNGTSTINELLMTITLKEGDWTVHGLIDESDFKWTKGSRYWCWWWFGYVYIYGDKGDSGYDYELQYTAGLRTRAWFIEHDKKYLLELVQNGKLEETEPAVWYWYKKEAPQSEISEWWEQKWAECSSDVTGEEMERKLANFEQEYKQNAEQKTKLRAKQEASTDKELIKEQQDLKSAGATNPQTFFANQAQQQAQQFGDQAPAPKFN